MDKKVYIIGYGIENDIHKFVEIALYEDKNMAIRELINMRQFLPEFYVLDYRIEVFHKNNAKNKYEYSNENIRLRN